MTVASTVSRIEYDGTGTSVSYSVPYYFLADSHLKVVLTEKATGVEDDPLVLDTDYAVTGAGDMMGGGFVTPVAVVPVTHTITIIREPDLLQSTDYLRRDTFPAESHEMALDKLTMAVQRAFDRIARCVQVSDTGSLPPADLIQSVLDATAAAEAAAVQAAAEVVDAEAAKNAAQLAQAAAEAAAGTVTPVGNQIHAAPSVSSMLDTDEMGFWDSVNSVLRKISWANLKALFIPAVVPGTSGNVLTSNGSAWTSQAPSVPASQGRLLSTRYYDGAAGTFTVIIASPGVFTKSAHLFRDGMMCRLTTTGALPTGLAINTTYFVVNSATNTFNLAATEGGSAINTSGSQSGTHTITPVYDKAINSPTYIEVEVQAGGGGGGGSGSAGGVGAGGGGGGYARKYVKSTSVGAVETITVGAGGGGGNTSGSNGTAGGSSSFGAIVSATGGSGGNGSTAGGAPSAGGIGSGGDINYRGGYGNGVYQGGLLGGGSFFSGGVTFKTDIAAIAATAPGGAGSGAAGSGGNMAGAAGYRGVVIVREYS